jgi:hypothetical protein
MEEKTENDRNQDASLNWLLQSDNPGVRYLALRDIVGLPPGDPELVKAQEQAHALGPIADILSNMHPDGYWVEPGAGYYPKYRGSVWSIILLSQLGASISFDSRIAHACEYTLKHALTSGGQFSISGAPSYTVDCLQGNLCGALLDLGVSPTTLDQAFDWMACTVTGEGIAPLNEKDTPRRYYAAKCGPLFACGANNKLPCAWGAVKVMLAFSKLPAEHWTPVIKQAIEQGVSFLLSVDPASAEYPCGYAEKPSQNWWKFGFPVFYVTDLLQNVEALARLGYGKDPRLSHALEVIRDKQDQNGCWSLEHDYSGKTWVEFGAKKKPNKWVTFRAIQALKLISSGHTSK